MERLNNLSLPLFHLTHALSLNTAYIRFEENKVHEMLKFNEYVHITSPIRRLVDLLNILSLPCDSP